MMDEYEKTHASTIAVMKVSHQEISKYGVIDPEDTIDKDLYDVKKFVEKPAVDKAPSNCAIDTLNQTQRVFAHVY